jgi:hypothetical protein
VLIRQRDANGNVDLNKSPNLIVIAAHLRAKRKDLTEEEFLLKKTEELHLIRKLFHEVRAKFPNSPVQLAGDLNLNLQTRSLFDSLKSELVDVLEITSHGHDRVTHTTFLNGRPSSNEVDTLFMDANLSEKFVDAYIYRYKDLAGKYLVYRDANGNFSNHPTSYDQRSQNVSDHYPVITILDMTRGTPISREYNELVQNELRELKSAVQARGLPFSYSMQYDFTIHIQGSPIMFTKQIETGEMNLVIDVLGHNETSVSVRTSFPGIEALLLSKLNTWIEKVSF